MPLVAALTMSLGRGGRFNKRWSAAWAAQVTEQNRAAFVDVCHHCSPAFTSAGLCMCREHRGGHRAGKTGGVCAV